MGMVGMLGIRAELFAAQPEQLVYEDSDRWRVTATQLLPMWMPKQASHDSGSTLHMEMTFKVLCIETIVPTIP